MANIPPIRPGHERQWVRCKTCGHIAFHDYIPYSLSAPIMSLPCHHDIGVGINNAVDRISADEALVALLREETK